MKHIRLPLALLIVMTGVVHACNIPVFRYALERWKPDFCSLTVFHDGTMSEADMAVVNELQRTSMAGNGSANFRIVLADVSRPLETDLNDLWLTVKTIAPKDRPSVVARSLVGGGKQITHWQGTLQQVKATGLLQSPVRQELPKRLQSGHAVVWLIVKSSDDNRNRSAMELLNTQLKKLASSIELPEGIGLPGSELFSEVPLLLRFSILEIDPNDPREQFLTKLLTGFHPESLASGEPLIVPVFGRGRALEVIPADNLNADLVEDLTVFLCGACSCQVKELNPGFDLLLSSDWNAALFGDGAAVPPEREEGTQRTDKPVLLPIPTGQRKK